MTTDLKFWKTIADLAAHHPITVDRPKGTAHPRYPSMIYPLDYGYIEGTTAGDGAGIDVWLGSLTDKTLTGILCTFDRLKNDAEIKLLIGCTLEDVAIIRDFNDQMQMIFIPNPMVEDALSN